MNFVNIFNRICQKPFSKETVSTCLHENKTYTYECAWTITYKIEKYMYFGL